MNTNLQWKEELVFDIDDPSTIGRDHARDLGVPWSTVWDFKQKLVTGAVTPESFLTKPKILLFDIETAPLVVHNWSLFQNFTSLNQIQEDWFMLSWAAKWFGEDEVFTDSLPEHPEDFTGNCAADGDSIDIGVVRNLYKLIDEADIIIGHNVKRFDNKKSKARFLKHGLTQPSPYRQIDTLDIAKREFALASNKLDWLATYLGHPNKVHHEGHELWTKCMANDPEAWSIMMEYNEYDTVLLEEVYKDIRGWSSNHVNLAVYYNDFAIRCTNCGSDDIQDTDKVSTTNLGRYAVTRCGNCGNHSKTRTNLLDKRKRRSLQGNII